MTDVMMLGKHAPRTHGEWDFFIGRWCDRCLREKGHRDSQGEEEGCEILTRACVFDIDEIEYPVEWRLGEDGVPCCTAFELDAAAQPGEVMRLREDKGQLRLFGK